MAEEQYRDLLRRVQQKAESYREQQQQAAEFQNELEAVKEVYGLTDQELSDILKEVESEVENQLLELEFRTHPNFDCNQTPNKDV